MPPPEPASAQRHRPPEQDRPRAVRADHQHRHREPGRVARTTRMPERRGDSRDHQEAPRRRRSWPVRRRRARPGQARRPGRAQRPVRSASGSSRRPPARPPSVRAAARRARSGSSSLAPFGPRDRRSTLDPSARTSSRVTSAARPERSTPGQVRRRRAAGDHDQPAGLRSEPHRLTCCLHAVGDPGLDAAAGVEDAVQPAPGDRVLTAQHREVDAVAVGPAAIEAAAETAVSKSSGSA